MLVGTTVSTVSATGRYLPGGGPQDRIVRPWLGQGVGRSAIDRADVDQEDQPKDRKQRYDEENSGIHVLNRSAPAVAKR